MQEFTITRGCGYSFLGDIKVSITAPAGIARSVMLGLAVAAALQSGANLSGANLSGADLSGANLSGADLRSADLSGANLSGANLSGANLRSADLSGANLSGANLSGANLSGADLRSADLAECKLPGFQIPQDGALTVWKRTSNGVAKLLIPAKAKRTASLVGRKCRAEYSKVLVAAEGAKSTSDARGPSLAYIVGATVRPDRYDPDIRVECSHGIHFFLTREEAEEYGR